MKLNAFFRSMCLAVLVAACPYSLSSQQQKVVIVFANSVFTLQTEINAGWRVVSISEPYNVAPQGRWLVVLEKPPRTQMAMALLPSTLPAVQSQLNAGWRVSLVSSPALTSGEPVWIVILER